MAKPPIRAGASSEADGDAPDLFNTEPAEDDPDVLYEEPPIAATPAAGNAPGHQLEVGLVYTRAQLKDLFAIKDATINNGVFRVSDRREI